MRPAGRLVTIRRSGDDGAHFPLSLRSCLLGRSIECDIRIQLPVVSKQHCKIEVKDQVAILYNFSSTNPTQVNGSAIHEPVQLKHGDVITIIDRSFRYEDESHQNGRKSPGLTGKRREQEQARRASRSSFSADPGAKGSDSKAHSNVSEGNASRKSLVHVGRLNDSSTCDGLEDSEGRVGHNDRNAGESTFGVLKEKSRVAVNCYRERKSCPVRSLDEGKKSESPFKKLYQSLKEELVTKSQKGEVDIKSQKQSVLPYRRKSVPPSDYARVKERETQLLLSHKPRPKSGGSAPVKAAASPELEAVQAEDPGGGVPSAQTSKEALSASPLNERAKVKTPARGSQPPKDEALHVTHSRESASLDESEGIGVPHEILTPKKLVTRNLTPRKAEDAKPENTSSRKRRRTSAKVEGPPAEIHTQALSTQRLAQCDTKTENDALTKPEKLGAATAAQMCSGSPGLISVDISNFGDSVHKIEGVSLKRRRVSFGGCLRPELFDENLPPNTPLKRGETPTKRRSLVTHTPVLKKIIKEQPLSSGKKEAPGICLKVTDQETCVGTSVSSPGVTPSRTTHDQRRRSGRASLASGDSKPPLQMDFAKKAARKSSILPSRRPSVSRSQHDILQMICSKRRSGASEANLIVAKSWADVVKLGTKQTQTKVVRHGLQRQMSKRQRRPSTPKKPTSSVHNQFSTGHANSPCTIVIGKAQIEKVNVPARPYRMLNNFVLNQKLDFSEDLSGLTEMFKTPAKEKQQQRRSRGSTLLSNSENLLGKHRQVTNLGEKPLPVASDILGANIPSSPLDAAKETSDQYFASPTLRRRSMKDGNTAKTPTVTHLEMKTPDSAAEPLKTVASTNKFRRSRQLRDAEMPPVESKSVWTEDLIEGFTGRRLRKTPLQGQEVKGEAPDSEQSLPRCKENVKSKSPETIPAMRRSRNGEPKGESTEDLSSSQVVLRTPGCVQEPAHGEEVTKIPSESSQPEAVGPPESRRRQLVAPLWSKDVKEDLFASGRLTQASEESTCTRKSPKSGTPVWKGTTKQKVGPEVDAIAIRPRPRTPEKKTQVLEDLVGLSELFRTPKHDESGSDDETKAPCRAPEPSTAQRKVAMEGDLSAPRKLVHVSRGDSPMLRVPDHKPGRNKAVKESAKQIRDPAASANSSKRHVGKAKKAECLEDLTGFQELFQTPGRGKDAGTVDKTTTMPCISPQQGPGRTPRSTKRLPKISRGEAHVGAELSALGELTQAPAAPAQQERSTRALMETPERKPEPTGNLTGHKRRPQTRKDRSQSLEDLTGFQELVQTPGAAKDQVATGEIIKMSLNSPQPEPVRTPASTKRLPKISLGKVVVKEEFSALREMTRSASKATPTVPRQEESGLKASTETPEQELDPSPRRRRRPHTPKRKYQLVEDLAGLQELFQTPGCANDLVTVHETPRMSLKSQPEPSRTPRNTKRLSKKSLGNVDVGEELSAPRKSTQSLGKVMLTPTEPVSQTKGTEAIMQTPEPKLEPTGNSSGPKRRPRTPKEKAQPLEDLAGFHELFQTPARASHPVAVDKTPRLSLNSLQADPVRTPASTKRLSKRSLGHVDVGEELWGYSTPPPMSGETTHTRQGPGEDGGLGASKQPVKRKLDPAARASGSKRLRRAPEEDTQPLEDLTGLQELFQTPARAQDPETIDETTQLTYRCPRTEPVITPRSTERLPRRSFGKVSVEGKVPAFRRLGQSPGKVTPTVLVQEQGAEGIADSPEQKLEPPENVTRRVRRSRTPKEKSQPLEDMAGFQELFQTPGHASDPATVDQTPMKSPQSEPVRTFPRTKRLSKASLGNVEAPVRLSALNKPTCASEEIILTPRLPEGDGRGSKDLEEPAPPTLDPAVRRTGSKKQRGARKEKAQPVEDLAGFQELFHTPRHGKDLMTPGSLTKKPVKSPQLGSDQTPQSTKKPPKASLGNVEAPARLRLLNKLTCASEEIILTPRLSEGDSRGSKDLEEPAPPTLDPAVRRTGSKKQRGARKEKAQPVEDLAGFQELFHTPRHGKEPVTVDKTMDMPCKSPQAEAMEMPVTPKRQPRTSLRKVHETKEPSGFEVLPPPSGKATGTSRVPGEHRGLGSSKHPKKRKLDPAARAPGSKRLRRAPEEETQPLEDLTGLQELFQTPACAQDPETMAGASEVREAPEAVETSTWRPRTRLRTADVGGEPTVHTERSGTSRETRSRRREPVCDNRRAKERKESLKQKEELAASVIGRRRPPRALGKAQPLGQQASTKELPQTPDLHEESASHEKTTEMPCKSLQPEQRDSPAASKRPLRMRVCKVDMKEEPTAQRKPSGRATRNAYREPTGNGPSAPEPKQSTKRKLDPAASAPGCKRPRRALKEERQLSEDLAGSKGPVQTPGNTEESLNDDKPTQVARNSSQPEKVGSPTASPRPRTRRGKAHVQEEPLAARKTVRASRRTARSHQGPEAGDQGIQAPKEAAKLTLDTGASVTGGRRRLRTPKEAAQPLEVPATSREVTQISGHTELLNDSQNLNTPEQMPDRVKPLRARGRVLRAPKGSPMEVSVDTRDPSASHSNTSQTLTRTSIREGRVSRTRGLRSVAPVQETADEKPIYTQRTAPSERHLSPEPPKMKQLRVVTRRIELVEEQISNSLKSKRRKPKVEEAVTPDQKMSLRSRRQNTTNTEQQKPEVVVSAEKTELKRNEKKPTKPPQETELQNAGEEAKTSTSRGNVRGRRICLRSGGQREVSQPPAVEEKAPEKSMAIPGKSQNKKGGTGDADGRSLRSRKTGVQPRGRALDSEPEPRVTRAARKGAENPKKDKDSERTKKVRTRSHRDS